MFERFTAAAKHVVTRAVREAQQQEAPEITPEHLALALLANASTQAGRTLAEHGVTREDIVSAYETSRRRGGLTDSETTALRGLGIDVDDVMTSVEGAHGRGAMATAPRRRRFFAPRGHIPFGADAKKVLEGSLREAVDLGNRRLGDEHLLLALLNSATAATDALNRRGLTYIDFRVRAA